MLTPEKYGVISWSVKVDHTAQPASLTFDLTSATSTTFQAPKAPAAIACETEHSGRHTQEERRGMCSDTLNPGGEANLLCGLDTGHAREAPFVFIVAASRYMGFLELDRCFFKRGCFGCGGISCFFKGGQARPSVRVRSCRMWFHFDESFIS